MNQDRKKIDVVLKKENNEDVLIFKFENEISINLVNSDNNSLKDVFKKILEELIKEKFEFELKIDEDYNVDLYKDVSYAYIYELNDEIDELVNSDEWKEIYE